jgi:2-amino-4-hydroxy-6-hydroxymethyldihydropteridine diphosphokinase
LVAESEWATAAPIGVVEQADFLNGAFLVETALDREAFRAYLKGVEDRLGRVREGNKYGPRTIDLDIVVWNREIVDKDF